jgi:hypothetical protein
MEAARISGLSSFEIERLVCGWVQAAGGLTHVANTAIFGHFVNTDDVPEDKVPTPRAHSQ